MVEQKSRTERIVERLRELRTSNPDVTGSAVVSLDGLLIASDLPPTTEEEQVSAMSAAMLALGDRIASELDRGQLDQVYIGGSNGYVLLMSAGAEAVLTMLARKGARLGLVLLDMRRAAADIASVV